MDKNKAIVAYILKCPVVSGNPTFFQFLQAQDNSKQILTASNDVSVAKADILGVQYRQFNFAIVDYRSVSYNPITTMVEYNNENLDEYIDVQGIADWIKEQNRIKNFPDFGEDIKIQSIQSLTDNPVLMGIDNTNFSPPLASYSITIRIEYEDYSESIIKP